MFYSFIFVNTLYINILIIICGCCFKIYNSRNFDSPGTYTYFEVLTQHKTLDLCILHLIKGGLKNKRRKLKLQINHKQANFVIINC